MTQQKPTAFELRYATLLAPSTLKENSFNLVVDGTFMETLRWSLDGTEQPDLLHIPSH